LDVSGRTAAVVCAIRQGIVGWPSGLLPAVLWQAHPAWLLSIFQL